MTIEEGVYAFLTAQTTITALATGGIFPDMAPKNATYPRLTYSLVSTTEGTQLRGTVDLPQARFTVEAWGLTRAEAANLGKAVRAAVKGWQKLDKAAAPKWGDVVVRSVTIADQADDYDPPQDASDVGAYRTRVDLAIWYEDI